MAKKTNIEEVKTEIELKTNNFSILLELSHSFEKQRITYINYNF